VDVADPRYERRTPRVGIGTGHGRMRTMTVSFQMSLKTNYQDILALARINEKSLDDY